MPVYRPCRYALTSEEESPRYCKSLAMTWQSRQYCGFLLQERQRQRPLPQPVAVVDPGAQQLPIRYRHMDASDRPEGQVQDRDSDEKRRGVLLPLA